MTAHSNLEKKIMLWMGKNFPGARVFRFDNGQAYAKHTVMEALRAALNTFNETRSIVKAMAAAKNHLQIITYGIEGWPDLVIIYYGVAIGIEVKTGKDRLRPKQKAMRQTFLQIGAAYLEVRDTDVLEEAISPTLNIIKKTMDKICQSTSDLSKNISG